MSVDTIWVCVLVKEMFVNVSVRVLLISIVGSEVSETVCELRTDTLVESVTSSDRDTVVDTERLA